MGVPSWRKILSDNSGLLPTPQGIADAGMQVRKSDGHVVLASQYQQGIHIFLCTAPCSLGRALGDQHHTCVSRS